MGEILRKEMVERLIKAIYPFKRPNRLSEGAHCTKLNKFEGVGVIFVCCRVEMSMSLHKFESVAGSWSHIFLL